MFTLVVVGFAGGNNVHLCISCGLFGLVAAIWLVIDGVLDVTVACVVGVTGFGEPGHSTQQSFDVMLLVVAKMMYMGH